MGFGAIVNSVMGNNMRATVFETVMTPPHHIQNRIMVFPFFYL